MPIFDYHFTVEEANALVPQLRTWLGRLHQLDRELAPLQARYGELLGKRREYNVGGSELSDYLVLSLQWRRIVETILEAGVQIKDLDRGLCDFPHLLPDTGEEVLLCWELSEPRVAHWHALDAGYDGRQPIVDTPARWRRGGPEA